MTQAESELPATEALEKLNWVVSEIWKHTTHDALYCDAEEFGDPIHIVAEMSCGKLTSNAWDNPHKRLFVGWVKKVIPGAVRLMVILRKTRSWCFVLR